MGPLGIGLLGGGATLVGDVLSNRDQGVPPWLVDMLREQATQDNYQGFLPDKQLYDANLQSQIDQLLGQLPVGLEAFNAEQASRGTFTAGEATGAAYRDVYAPIARAGTQAITQSNLGYAQAYQQGSIQAANLRQNYMQLLVNSVINRRPSITGSIGSGLAGLGKIGTQFSLLKALGIFDEG